MNISEKDSRRFWSKVQLPDAAGCMLWTGARIGNGYGHMGLNGAHLIHPKGRRRGPRRPGVPTFRTRARRASGNEWFAVFQYGVRDPRAVA